jgi:hypothetical protein
MGDPKVASASDPSGAAPIDTINKFGVAMMGDRITFLITPPRVLIREDALLFAAWIVALADFDGDRFQHILNAVNDT